MPKVVIVEDEAAIRHMYALKFKFSQFEVCEAVDGYEGLKIIEQELPDIVLLDLKMPKMSGDEMLRAMRATDWGNEIPVIILTNISKDEAPRTLWHLGVADYIVKSHSTPQKILETVQRVLTNIA